MVFNLPSLKLSLGVVLLIGLVKLGQCDSIASILKFPSFASIESNNQHICSGAVVDHKFVITSVQCLGQFDLSRDVVNVRVGMDKRGFRGEVNNVAANYSDTLSVMGSAPTDMALLQLATHIRYRSKASWSNLAMVFITEGLEGEVPVWLDTKWKSSLSSVTMKTLSHDDCVSVYQGIQTIDDTMECLVPVDEPQLACLVDLGSPFLAQEQVFGVVSRLPTCDGTNNLPMVITAVPKTANFVVISMTGIAELFAQILPS